VKAENLAVPPIHLHLTTTSDNGFIKPRTKSIDGREIVRPGFLGNIFIGAISAGVSWGLYGSLANEIIVTLIEESERGKLSVIQISRSILLQQVFQRSKHAV
jgi:hypothetical protein